MDLENLYDSRDDHSFETGCAIAAPENEIS